MLRHTITEPPPNLSFSMTQASVNRSPRCRYMRFRPSARYRENHESSPNRTCLQWCIGNWRRLCPRNQIILMWHLLCVSWGPTYGRLAYKPTSVKRFRTGFGWILLLWHPGVFTAVSTAVLTQSGRWAKSMAQFWREVSRGRPLRGLSANCPVARKRCRSRLTVDWATPCCLATCLWLQEALY